MYCVACWLKQVKPPNFDRIFTFRGIRFDAIMGNFIEMKTLYKLILGVVLVVGMASCTQEHDVSTGFQCNFEHGSYGESRAAFGSEKIYLEGTVVMGPGLFYIGLFDPEGNEVYSSIFDNTLTGSNSTKTYFIDASVDGHSGTYLLSYESTNAEGSLNVKLHN